MIIGQTMILFIATDMPEVLLIMNTLGSLRLGVLVEASYSHQPDCHECNLMQPAQ